MWNYLPNSSAVSPGQSPLCEPDAAIELRTNKQINNSALHPSGFAKLSTSFGWSKGKTTAVGWQVTLYDRIWYMIFLSYYELLYGFTYLLLLLLLLTYDTLFVIVAGNHQDYDINKWEIHIFIEHEFHPMLFHHTISWSNIPDDRYFTRKFYDLDLRRFKSSRVKGHSANGKLTSVGVSYPTYTKCNIVSLPIFEKWNWSYFSVGLTLNINVTSGLTDLQDFNENNK